MVKTGPGVSGTRLMEVAEPQAKEAQVKIQIHTAGICGTDIHIFKDEYPVSPPVILGHEFSGTVVDCGPSVTRFSPGDRVVSLTAAETCGHCRYCREGLIMLCEARKSIGSGMDGAFAEYMVVPEAAVIRIPEAFSLEEATLLEPAACVVRSVLERSRVCAGDRVLVTGPGTIGQLALQIARSAGAEVFVSGGESDSDRLKLAEMNGAKRAFVYNDEDAVAAVLAMIGENGFDVAYECSGAEAAVNQCINLLRKQGQYVQVGLFGRNVSVDFDKVLVKEIEVKTSFGTKMSSWERAISLMVSGQLRLSQYISGILPLSEWENAFSTVLRREGFKTLLDPGR